MLHSLLILVFKPLIPRRPILYLLPLPHHHRPLLLAVLLSLLSPVGINISLNNSFLLSFLNVYAPLFAPLSRMAEPTPFLHPPEISLFWGTSIAITPSGTQEVLPTPTRRKHSTGSSLLISSPSMTLTHLHFYIAPLAVAPPLTSLLLPSLLPFLLLGGASGSGF